MLKKSFNINLEKRMKNNDNNTFDKSKREKARECSSVCNSSDDGSEKDSRLCFNAMHDN